MKQSSREKVAWLFSGAVLCYFALSIPGTLAQRDDDYRFVRTLVDIYRQVSTNYVEKVEDADLQQAAISGMLRNLDPHTLYVPPDQQESFNDALDGNFKGVGIRLSQNEAGEIEVVTPIDDSPAWEAGVLPGDIILKVNDESIIGERLDDIIPRIQGPSGSVVKLTLRHSTGETVDISLTRREFVVPMIKGLNRQNDNTWNYWINEEQTVAYVRLTQFTPGVAEQFGQIMRTLLGEGMKGLVIDLRFNPGGRLQEAEQMIDLFVSKGTLVSVKGRNRRQETKQATAEGTLPPFPMVVLVNEHSASASEVMAGSLKDNKRATVVGARTYGKGSVQEVMKLDANDGELKLTVAYWYLPSGRLVQRLKDATEWGVEPDVVVPMDEGQQRDLVREQIRTERMSVSGGASKGPVGAPSGGASSAGASSNGEVPSTSAGSKVDESAKPTMPATQPTTATAQPATTPGPTNHPIEVPATGPTINPTTSPTTGPIDPQLDKAVDLLRQELRK